MPNSRNTLDVLERDAVLQVNATGWEIVKDTQSGVSSTEFRIKSSTNTIWVGEAEREQSAPRLPYRLGAARAVSSRARQGCERFTKAFAPRSVPATKLAASSHPKFRFIF